MNTIAIIEDKVKDFDSVKNLFKASNVVPENFSLFWKDKPVFSKSPQPNEYEPILVDWICKKLDDIIDEISAIIMDISLYNEIDETGIKVIKEIKNKKDAKYRLIPIFCYSKHGSSDIFKDKAYLAGATNVFEKQYIGSNAPVAQRQIAQFLITTRAQMIAYELSMGEIRTLHNTQEVLSNIHNTLKNSQEMLLDVHNKQNITTEMLLSMMRLTNLDGITNDEEKKQLIVKSVGGEEQFNQIYKKMSELEERNKQAETLEDTAKIMEAIPGINLLFPAVLRAFGLFRKYGGDITSSR